MSAMSRSRVVGVVLAAAVGALSQGCGDIAPNEPSTVGVPRPAPAARPPSPTEPAPLPDDLASLFATPTPTRPPTRAGGVLYDDAWVVEEGVWYLGSEFPTPDRGAPRLLASAAGGVSLFTPALYGKFSVRVVLERSRPEVPAWCEDVEEASLRAEPAGLVMGSFETFSDRFDIAGGWYRVRYCTEKLDTVARETAEDEFEGDDYKLYSGRNLIQLWPAARDPDRVIRHSSHFARTEAHG